MEKDQVIKFNGNTTGTTVGLINARFSLLWLFSHTGNISGIWYLPDCWRYARNLFTIFTCDTKIKPNYFSGKLATRCWGWLFWFWESSMLCLTAVGTIIIYFEIRWISWLTGTSVSRRSLTCTIRTTVYYQGYLRYFNLFTNSVDFHQGKSSKNLHRISK